MKNPLAARAGKYYSSFQPIKLFRPSSFRGIAPLVAALFVGSGCGEKGKPQPKQYHLTPPAAEGGSSPAVAPPEPSPATPVTVTPAPESAAGQAKVPGPGWGGKSEAQKREVYMRWLQEFKSGTAAQRQKLVVEIRLTPLTAEDTAELEKLRQHYGVAPLR